MIININVSQFNETSNSALIYTATEQFILYIFQIFLLITEFQKDFPEAAI